MIITQLVLIYLYFINSAFAHGPDVDVDTFHQGLNIQITGIANTAASDENPQHCKVGKAGPKGRNGRKGEKGDAAKVCECLANQALSDKVNHLEALLLQVVSKTSRDCQDVQTYFQSQASGVQTITPSIEDAQVYCDLDDDGRIWTVIQRRFDGSEDFNREWNDYVNGFGRRDSEYWLGLNNIHLLTRNGDCELKVDIVDWEGVKKFALYSTFIVSTKESGYTLTVGGHSGTAGDSMEYHHGQRFSTKDHDMDSAPSANCGNSYLSGWWFNCCLRANPNGLYLKGNEGSNAKGVDWEDFYRPPRHYSFKSIAMKIRRKL